MNQKNKRRFNSLDCCILILILVIGGAFLAKAPLAHLFSSNGEVKQVTFTFSTEDSALISLLREGEELVTSRGLSLGTVTALHRTDGEGVQRVDCTVTGYAGRTEAGFIISTDTVLSAGKEITLRFGDQLFVVTLDGVWAE